ncbi:MAG: hypothetical protein IJJ26_00965 [Victivallales bacterium]|nr:hypothetical protein [Victivallales bacterium]
MVAGRDPDGAPRREPEHDRLASFLQDAHLVGDALAQRVVRRHTAIDGERVEFVLPVVAQDGRGVRRCDLGLEDAVEEPVAVLQVLARGQERRRRLGVDAELADQINVLAGRAPEVHRQAEAAYMRAACGGIWARKNPGCPWIAEDESAEHHVRRGEAAKGTERRHVWRTVWRWGASRRTRPDCRGGQSVAVARAWTAVRAAAGDASLAGAGAACPAAGCQIGERGLADQQKCHQRGK